ncbi:MAG: FAD-binding oxidoreductase [Planctomycetota bacterium]|nr:FAD-binding oxidoreductase [Planctomycetota bacterium]
MTELLDSAIRTELREICPFLDDPASCLAYARDLWPLGHITAGQGKVEALGKRPWGVSCPRNEEEVCRVVKVAAKAKIPIIPFGEGSGVCGGTVAHRGGITIDLKQLRRIERIDRESLTITVGAGINGQLLEEALEREYLTLGHSPSSILCSTVGGWLAARSAGQFSTLYGKIEDMVISMRVVLPDGQLVETITAPKSATGPDWNQLFVGCEGTLGIITAATLRVHTLPPARDFLSFSVPDVKTGLAVIRETLQRGYRPAAVRLYDPLDTILVGEGKDHKPIPADSPVGPEGPLKYFTFQSLSELLKKKLPKAADTFGKKTALSVPALTNKIADRLPSTCLLILTFEGQAGMVEVMGKETRKLALAMDGVKDKGSRPAEVWWRNRHAVSFKQSDVFKMGAFSDTMEVATTWDRINELYHYVRSALGEHALVLAHFSHAYHEGCSIYFSVAARCSSPEEAEKKYKAVWEAGMKATVEKGAAVSHHHGIGLLKAKALKESQGPLHGVYQKVKDALDPDNIMNPGKMGLS